MAIDYAGIRAENQRRYGTDIGRIGPMLLAHRYHDRTHFIFELLQNAEDALARRKGWNGPRAVKFALSKSELRVSHSGIPFSEPDVRGICGIAESTKEEDTGSIGRFGIGFKSVYALTDRPEIHSGSEHFAIDCFVWPEELQQIELARDETRFCLPLRPGDSAAADEIARSLQRLGPRTLLFLREIEEVSWSVEGGPSGLYLRDTPKIIAENARTITVVGQHRGAADVTEETWLIFAREVNTASGTPAGHVELAFALSDDRNSGRSVLPVDDAALVVFFPTIVPTGTRFLIQGPYRTTPSRDNVPREEPWNQHLIRETATLLSDALIGLRELGILTASALRTLPLDRSKCGDGSLFEPLFGAAREALASRALVPRFAGGHIAATCARLARTQDLRELFNPSQLTGLFQAQQELGWVSEEITQDRAPELRQYLMYELKVPELRSEDVLPILTREFLEQQPDSWVARLYTFLQAQPALVRSGRLSDVPIIRLENGTHVKLFERGVRQAFLPGPNPTGFPTVRRAVCGTEEARGFLQAFGVTEPDPVDDVIRNVLARYRTDQRGEALPESYPGDVERMLNAFETDSKSRRDVLVSALKRYPFVAAIDAGTGKRCFAKPPDLYIATERLSELFEGVAGVLLVDDSVESLRGEGIRELLEASGATRYLERAPVAPNFGWEERAEMRRAAGWERSTGGDAIEDFTIRGVDGLLDALPALPPERAAEKAAALWAALCDFEDRRGARAFSGTYRWYYHSQHSCEFDAAFVRRLNEVAWIPDGDGELQPPKSVVFGTLVWKEDQYLLSKIRFKPPIIETLAREAGIEPGVLDLLKTLGMTSEAALRARLGISEPAEPAESAATESETESGVEPTSTEETGAEPNESQPEAGTDPTETTGGGGGAGTSHNRGGGTGNNGGGGPARGGGSGGHSRSPGSAGGRPFISYVGIHPDEGEIGDEHLTHEQRLELEEKAIALILAEEPKFVRVPGNNPGFDLVEPGPYDEPVCWVEVKAMTGDLESRPVGMSRKQFETAQIHEDHYWLYVVEYADTPGKARIVKVQDPAGKARTFTFDRGWISIAEITRPESAALQANEAQPVT